VTIETMQKAGTTVAKTPVEALEEQLHIFARDAVVAYRREKARAAELEQALETLEKAFLETIRSMAFVVEAKDAYTGQHLERCRVYGMALLNAIGLSGEYPDAQYGFLLHDSGKVGIPDSILDKPGPLTSAQWRVMRTHPLIGYQMLEKIPFLSNAAEIVRSHHEMWDGTGYPEGLAGEQIPLAARVFSVVDAYDAMTTNRPYRAALPAAHAADEIARMGGTQFDPEVARAYVALIPDLPSIGG
jgi:HD-GYP domain-containing protein (c-di-GMP phosphodiesterase class II)